MVIRGIGDLVICLTRAWDLSPPLERQKFQTQVHHQIPTSPNPQKMTDSLKIFVQKHRAAFDAAVPGAHGWSGLERMLERLPNACALERQLMCDRVLLDTEMPAEMVWARIETDLDSPPEKLDLESFIQKNREAFDTELPQGQIWENISGSLPKPRAKVLPMDWQRPLMRIAASLMLLVAGIGGGIWYERHGGATSGMAMSDVSGEYAELEQF